MVINIWRYDSGLNSVASPKLKQDLAFSTSLSRARYIFDIQLSAADIAVMEQVKPVGDYVNTDSAAGHRIEGRHAYNLSSEDPEDQSREIAIYGARAGLKRFWHIAVSSREDEHLTLEQLEHVRAVVRRVLGVTDCPSIWADHRDTDNDHMHGLVVSFLPEQDRAVMFGQDWWKEASQIAMAIIERDLDLEPEPNRRFVADRTGVYHTYSDIRVADENGKILGRSEIVAAQKAHKAWKRDNYAAHIAQSGEEWEVERAVQVLAKPRILKSNTAAQVHESLARVGLKYVAGQSGARIVANGYLPEAGQHAQGQSIAATKAYGNAALKKLGNRLEGGYQPAAPDLAVRKFVMPRFEKLTEEERDRFADRRAEIEECKDLADHLEKHNGDFYRRMRDVETGDDVNERRAQRRRSHEREVAQVKTLEKFLSKPFRDTRVFPGEEGDTLALLWGPPAGASSPAKARREAEERRELEDRYRIEATGDARKFWYGENLAFIERLRTIEIVSQKRRARIDAIKLARYRFRRLRIASAQKVRRGLARIAAELGVALEKGPLRKLAIAHVLGVRAGLIRSVVASSRAFHDTYDDRKEKRTSAHGERRRCGERSRVFAQPGRLLHAGKLVTDYVLDMQASSLTPNAVDPVLETRRTLANEIDHDTLWLAPSRYRASHEGLHWRFLDDPVLVETFKDKPHCLLNPAIQRDLAAIEAIQIERRRWIASAIVAGAASIEEGELHVARDNASWAAAFWKAQRSDPTFQRLIAVARARPDRFTYDENARPGERSQTLALQNNDPALAKTIARQMHAYERTNIATAKGKRSPMKPATIPSQSAVPELASARSSRTKAGISRSTDRTDQKPPEPPRHPGHPSPDGIER